MQPQKQPEKEKRALLRKTLNSTKFFIGSLEKALGIYSGGSLELLVWEYFLLCSVSGHQQALSFFEVMPTKDLKIEF